jgi:4,5-DOPA dioxygenase extradiol
LTARTTTVSEPRGIDGLGEASSGFDHGVFIPFRHMFGLEMDIPIVQVSIDSSFDPEKEWKIGRALDELRYVACKHLNRAVDRFGCLSKV